MEPPRHRRPAWLTAAVAPVTLVVSLVVAQALDAQLSRGRGPDAGSSYGKWLLESYDTFFGGRPLQTGAVLAGNAVGVLVLLVLGFCLTWLMVRGLAPGSGLLPLFASTWLVMIVTTLAASLANYGVLARSTTGSGSEGAVLYALTGNGIVFGFKYGLVAALLATWSWTRTRPRTDDSHTA